MVKHVPRELVHWPTFRRIQAALHKKQVKWLQSGVPYGIAVLLEVAKDSGCSRIDATVLTWLPAIAELLERINRQGLADRRAELHYGQKRMPDSSTFTPLRLYPESVLTGDLLLASRLALDDDEFIGLVQLLMLLIAQERAARRTPRGPRLPLQV